MVAVIGMASPPAAPTLHRGFRATWEPARRAIGAKEQIFDGRLRDGAPVRRRAALTGRLRDVVDPVARAAREAVKTYLF
ncbi:MAG TPA: hypothetical protein VFX14_22670 [Methylomirabilota bacterium]|nr:hypothetical protein [Methylomirabilota bacterium]